MLRLKTPYVLVDSVDVINGLNVGGNVGIGTSSPACKLDVNGEIRSNVTIRGQYVYAYNNTASGSYIGVFKGQGELPGYPNDYHPVLKTDHTDMYFSTNGKWSAALGSSAEATVFRLKNPADISETKVYLNTNGPSYFNGGSLKVAGPCTTSAAVTETINTGLGATEVPVYTTGTFACSLFDGGTYRATATASYTLTGNVVNLKIPCMTGSVTATTETYLRYIPTIIKPSTTVAIGTTGVSNNGNVEVGLITYALGDGNKFRIRKGNSDYLTAGVGGLAFGYGGTTYCCFTYFID